VSGNGGFLHTAFLVDLAASGRALQESYPASAGTELSIIALQQDKRFQRVLWHALGRVWGASAISNGTGNVSDSTGVRNGRGIILCTLEGSFHGPV